MAGMRCKLEATGETVGRAKVKINPSFLNHAKERGDHGSWQTC